MIVVPWDAHTMRTHAHYTILKVFLNQKTGNKAMEREQ